jgi:hypothetical protein
VQLLAKTAYFVEVFSSARRLQVADFGSLKRGRESLRNVMPGLSIRSNSFTPENQSIALETLQANINRNKNRK